jgi:serine/threonine protein kinase
MKGSMGIVYLLENTQPVHFAEATRLCAKTFSDEWFSTDIAKQRFIEEAENWILIGRHEHVISAYDYRTLDSVPYVLMEFADSGNLIEKRESGFDPLEPSIDYVKALVYAFGIALGLERIYATVNLPHGDLRPENILFDRGGELVRISDFGLMSSITSSDQRAESRDIVQFGQLLWYLFTGRSDTPRVICDSIDQYEHIHAPFRQVVKEAVMGAAKSARGFFVKAAETVNDVAQEIGGIRFPTPEEYKRSFEQNLAKTIGGALEELGVKSIEATTTDTPFTYVNRALSLLELGNVEAAGEQIVKAVETVRGNEESDLTKEVMAGLQTILSSISDLEVRRRLLRKARDAWKTPWITA